VVQVTAYCYGSDKVGFLRNCSHKFKRVCRLKLGALVNLEIGFLWWRNDWHV